VIVVILFTSWFSGKSNKPFLIFQEQRDVVAIKRLEMCSQFFIRNPFNASTLWTGMNVVAG